MRWPPYLDVFAIFPLIVLILAGSDDLTAD